MKLRLHSIGNDALIKNPKTGFLCSRSPGPDAVLAAYAWAREQCDLGSTVISGFHSPVERDVFEILARRGAYMIQLYAKRLPRRLERDKIALLESGRLLILSQHPETVTRETRHLCLQRNDLVRHLADTVFEIDGISQDE